MFEHLKNVGRKLREARREQGIKIEVMAVACGITVNTVEAIELGRPVRLVTAMRVCQRLSLSLSLFDLPIPTIGGDRAA